MVAASKHGSEDAGRRADAERQAEEARRRAAAARERGEGVHASGGRGGDAADITEEDKKIMAEVKAMGSCPHTRTKEEVVTGWLSSSCEMASSLKIVLVSERASVVPVTDAALRRPRHDASVHT